MNVKKQNTFRNHLPFNGNYKYQDRSLRESPAALYTQTKTPCLLTFDLARACPVLTLRQASCLSLSQTSAETGIPASKREETMEIHDDIWWIETTESNTNQPKQM